MVGRYHGVDQSPVQRLFCAVAAAQVPDLAGTLVAGQTGEQGGAEAGVHRADFRANLTQLRSLGSDGEITQGHQHIAAADRVAVDSSDHRFGNVANNAL
ncbi:hypothetical protein D3C84_1070940 [compost metagenome]